MVKSITTTKTIYRKRVDYWNDLDWYIVHRRVLVLFNDRFVSLLRQVSASDDILPLLHQRQLCL